jgi:hypothetical protein
MSFVVFDGYINKILANSKYLGTAVSLKSLKNFSVYHVSYEPNREMLAMCIVELNEIGEDVISCTL